MYGPYHGLDDHTPRKDAIGDAATNMGSRKMGRRTWQFNCSDRIQYPIRMLNNYLTWYIFDPMFPEKNVTLDGFNFVYSETMGVIRTRTQISMISVWTHRYPTVAQVINNWVKQKGWINDDFSFSSLTANKKSVKIAQRWKQ